MNDLIYLVALVGFFLASVAYLRACQSL